MPRRCLQITEAKIIVENISYAQVAIAAVKSVAFDKLQGIPCNFPVNFVYGGGCNRIVLTQAGLKKYTKQVRYYEELES